jgi:hypothetical protein
MDLVTLVTACALAVDPKLMHAMVWHQSGGEPWAVSVQGEPNPRVYQSMTDAIKETQSDTALGQVRIGLAGIRVPTARVSASVFLPCRNVAMAADQISRLTRRCTTHPRLKADPTFCAVAVYRGSWEQPDIKFATDVAASVAKGDAPNFDMPRGTSTEIFDTANDVSSPVETRVINMTSTFADQARSWSSALFPTKSKPSAERSERTANPAPPAAEQPSSTSPEALPFKSNPHDRDLFVRRGGAERAQ